MRLSARLMRQSFLLLPAAICFGNVVFAQSTSPDSLRTAMRGIVITAIGDHSVEGAVVTLVEASLSVTTDKAGAYQFAGIVPGTYTVRVRKMGYSPLDARITISANATLEADLELEQALAQPLPEVSVRASPVRSDLTGGLADRMRFNANGIFLVGAQLDSARGTPLYELLLRRVRGVNIVSYVQTNQHLLATGRGLTSLTQVPKADPRDRKSPSACYSQIWLDGVRIYAPGENQVVPDLGAFDVGALQAIEFYSGPSSTPAQFGGSGAACGTLLIWTRTR